MGTNIDLSRYILPEAIFTYFLLNNVEEENNRLHFYLDELNDFPEEYQGEDMESKGFHKETVLKDFPLRDKPLYLHVRRRRWLNRSTGEVVSRDWRLVSAGTHYTEGFASFLKAFVRVGSRNGLYSTLRKNLIQVSQRSKFSFFEFCFLIPCIIAGQVNMFPTQRGYLVAP